MWKVTAGRRAMWEMKYQFISWWAKAKIRKRSSGLWNTHMASVLNMKALQIKDETVFMCAERITIQRRDEDPSWRCFQQEKQVGSGKLSRTKRIYRITSEFQKLRVGAVSTWGRCERKLWYTFQEVLLCIWVKCHLRETRICMGIIEAQVWHAEN